MALAAIVPRPAEAFDINITYCHEVDSPFEVDNEQGTTLLDTFYAAAWHWEQVLVGNDDLDVCVSWAADLGIGDLADADSASFDIDVYYDPTFPAHWNDPVNSPAPWFVDTSPYFHSEFNFVGVGSTANNFAGQTLFRDLTTEQQNLWFNGSPPDVLEVGFRGDSAGWTDPMTGMPSAAQGSYDLFSTAVHELGHLLGVNYDPLAETWDPAPYQVGGATMEIEPHPQDSGHIRAQSALICRMCGVRGMRRLPSAIDILAIDADEGPIIGVDLPRKDFVAGPDWHNFLGWIGGRVPDFDDVAFVRHGGTVSLNADATVKSLEISFGDSRVRTENHTLSVLGGLTAVSTELSVNANGDAVLSDLTLRSNGKLHMDGGRATVSGLLHVLSFNGGSTIYGQGDVDVGEQLLNSGTIRAEGGTLRFAATGATEDVLNLDGAGEGVAEFGTVLAEDGDLFFDGQLTDDFDGEMRIGDTRSIAFTGNWTLGEDGVLEMSAPFPAIGHTSLSALHTTVQGNVRVEGTAIFGSDAAFEPSAEVELLAFGARLRLEGFNTFAGGSYTGSGILDQRGSVHVLESTTISVAAYDWDGSAENSPSYTRVLPHKTFTIDSNTIDEVGDGYDGEILLEGGILEVNTKRFDERTNQWVTAPWMLDDGGEMHLLNSRFWDETFSGNGALVRGAPIHIAGRVVGRGLDNRIESDAIRFDTTTHVVVAEPGDEIILDAPIEYRGGSYTGEGRLRQFGDALFQLDTTIDTKIYDWDGDEDDPSTTTIGSGRTVVLRPEQIDFGSDGFDGLVQIHQGTLIVNTRLHEDMVVAFLPWTLDEDGTIDLFDNAAVSGTGNPSMLNHPAGSRMIAAGHINATGTGNTIYSPTTFRPTAQVHVNAGGNLILEGPIRYEGGNFTGAGVLVQNGEGHVVAPTTINTSIFDFDGSFEAAVWTLESDLTLDVGQLEDTTINSNVFDGTIEAKSDSTLTLNLAGGSRWEMHGTLAVGTGNAAGLRVAGVPVKLAGTVFVGTGSELIFDADVSGSVQFNGGGTVVFNGANNPGNSPGVQRFEGDVEFGPSSLLTIEIASRRTEDHDRLEASGKLTLDGTLKVETIGDAELQPGSQIVIAKYGGLEGEFDGIQAPLLGDGMMFALDYGASELSLVYTTLGDFDADFRVTRADAAIVAANFGMENGATISHGDLNGDGRVGIADAAIFQANFGRSIADLGAARRAAVPEPTGIVLVAVGLIFIARFRPVTKSGRRAA